MYNLKITISYIIKKVLYFNYFINNLDNKNYKNHIENLGVVFRPINFEELDFQSYPVLKKQINKVCSIYIFLFFGKSRTNVLEKH